MERDVTHVTVASLVHRGVALADPDGTDDACTQLLLAFEDDDRPAVGLGGLLREELGSSVGGLDPEHDSGGVSVAAAVAFYLSTKPGGGSDDDATIREAVRVTWGDDPPEHVSGWLAAQGLEA
jgi:hypothetical protein